MSRSLSRTAATPAVEVIATLGDSIVGVRHVSNPRGGRTQPFTRGLIVSGAIGVVAGVVAFFVATRIASANQEALAAWVAASKPAWAFRPDEVPVWLSVMSFLGLSGGLTALVAGVARMRREREPSTVSIGSAAGVDFAIAGTPAPRVDLVAPQDDGFVLALSGMTGEVTGPDGARTIDWSAKAVPVVEGLRARASLGGVVFHIAAVEAPRRQTTPILAFMERRTMAFFAASAAAHLALWAFARTVPPDAKSGLSEIKFEEPLSYRVAGIDNETTPPEIEPTTEAGEQGQEGGPNAMALEQGTIGSPRDNSADPAKRQIKNRNDSNELARLAALEQARTAGVLGTESLSGDLFASIVGTGEVSSHLDEIDMIGGFDGDGVGAPFGFGQNRSGFGIGGGGQSFKVGGYNTIGDGNRVGQGFKLGYGTCIGKGCIGGRRPAVPPVKIGPPQDVIGDYDKEIIKRYVRRKKEAIGYCYEHQLLVNQKLEGTVLAEWTINANGGVIESRASGVDPAVSSCIAKVIESIQFPKPPAIGVFKVRYPFVLHNTGKS